MEVKSSFASSSIGTQLRILEWELPNDPKAVVLFTHGYAGHAARYENFAEAMKDSGYICIGIDLTGHGKSGGVRAYIDSFDEYIDDFRTLYDFAVDKYKGLPFFIFGHSMGALVVTTFALKDQPIIKGVILSGIALYVTDSVPNILVKISTLMSKVVPKLPSTKLDAGLISSKKEAVNGYIKDPLIYHGGIRARTGYEFMVAAEWARSQLEHFNYPVLLMHGAEDGLANKQGSIDFHNKAKTSDKTLRLLDGLYHEILNEDSAPEILKEIGEWIDNRL